MGHRLSKTAANKIVAHTANENRLKTTTATNIVPIPNKRNKENFMVPTINLQIQESPTACIGGNYTIDNTVNNHRTATAGISQQLQYNTNSNIGSSLTSVNNLSYSRQIIIKIQLAKMENGNETSTSLSSSALSLSQDQQQLQQDASLENPTADCNLNSTTELSTTVTAAGTQFLNLTLNSSNSNCNLMPNPNITTTTVTSKTVPLSSSVSLLRTAGSSLSKNNNYLHPSSGSATTVNSISNIMSTSRLSEDPERFNSLQFNDEIVEENIEYCEVLEDHLQQPQISNSGSSRIPMLSITEEPDNETNNVCCRRKSKSLAANGGSAVSPINNTGAKTKSRCRKCSCRDAFKRFLDPSLSRSSNKGSKQQKEQKRTKSQDRHSINSPILNNTNREQQHHHHLNSMHSTPQMMTNSSNPFVAAAAPHLVVPAGVSNPISLWRSTAAASGSGDVIIPLTTQASPQFVVVQCAIVNPLNEAVHPLCSTNATSTSASLHTNNMLATPSQNISPSTSITSISNDLMVKVPLNSTRTSICANTLKGPIVHSHVDFVHYLVPDLENIVNSSFYWGKIDRYEAERLLDCKPEGTFLLRDSAQEEFLFSVTFRKYGRSLHARIEQSDHRFSFDCHDPCVFTAPTVTGLLEHYKDPACVMFFEPMLTVPLHRRYCFSLQKLCRATIVSNTTYDGINELELPARLKSYLKEYHYKQKLRVKSNEGSYALHCK